MLLLGLLIFLTYKTGRKAVSLHRCEVRYLAQKEVQRTEQPKENAKSMDAATFSKHSVSFKALSSQYLRLAVRIHCLYLRRSSQSMRSMQGSA